MAGISLAATEAFSVFPITNGLSFLAINTLSGSINETIHKA